MRKLIQTTGIVLALIGVMMGAGMVLLDAAPFLLRRPVTRDKSWEDDARNWWRAFHEEQPAAVKVVHSKCWERSDSRGHEYICCFELQATPEWIESSLRKADYGESEEEDEAEAAPSRSTYESLFGPWKAPAWFAPGEDDLYEYWYTMGYGSVWVHKVSGQVFYRREWRFRASEHGRSRSR